MSQLTLEQRLGRAEQEIAMLKKMIVLLPGNSSTGGNAVGGNEIMNARQLAKFMQIDVNVVYTKCAKGEIPHFKLGKQYRFKKIDIMTWMKEQAVESEFSVDAYVNRYLQKKELRG